MKSLYAAAALMLLATPVLAQAPAGDAELQSQTPFYQSAPAHQGVVDLAKNGPAGDAEAHTQNVYTIENVGNFAANQAAIATDAASSAVKAQPAQDDSWRNQP